MLASLCMHPKTLFPTGALDREQSGWCLVPEYTAITSPYTSRCLLVWLLPCNYDSSASPAYWQGVYCCASRTGIVGRAFHPTGLMGQISVRVPAFSFLSSILLHAVMAVGSETDLFIWCLCSLYRSSFLMADCSACVLSARHHREMGK